MKTRVSLRLDSELVAGAREEALRRGHTLARFVEDAVRRELNHERRWLDTPFVLPVFHPSTPGYAPGFPVNGTYAEILDFLDDEEMVAKITGRSADEESSLGPERSVE